jgi:hypothetical protein
MSVSKILKILNEVNGSLNEEIKRQERGMVSLDVTRVKIVTHLKLAQNDVLGAITLLQEI